MPGQNGWILAKFSFCMLMDQDRVKVHKLAKKEQGQYPAILAEQAWSIKDLVYGFFLRDTVGSSERARWRYLAHSGSQSQHRIRFILPAHGASHIITVSGDR